MRTRSIISAGFALTGALLWLTGCSQSTSSNPGSAPSAYSSKPVAGSGGDGQAVAKSDDLEKDENAAREMTANAPAYQNGQPEMQMKQRAMPSGAGNRGVAGYGGAPSGATANAGGGMPGGGGGFGASGALDGHSGSFGGGRSFGGSGSFGSSSMSGMARGQATPRSAPLAVAPKPTYNPNMYVSNTYIGGSGEKDRIEKLINAGVMVDGKHVKLEAFSRNYAQAFSIPTQTALNLIAATERTKIIQDGDHTYLQVGLQAMKGEAPRRPSLNVALVIDRSGSMGNESKLEFAKAAATQLVDRLGGNDVFSLVVFDDQAQLLVSAQRVNDKAKVKRLIASIQPGGGTNIYGGLTLGYKEIQKHPNHEGVNRLILLSDGEVTAGVSDPEQFRRLVTGNVDKDIQTTSVGLGVEYNEDLMLSIARDGKGNYHFIKGGADTQTVFAKELDELTHIVAKAVKLRIRLADGVGLVRVLGAAKLDAEQTRQVKADEKKIDRKVYEELGIAANRQKEKDEPGIKMLIPDFYRGDNHVVMLELAVPKGQGRRKVADVFLKYKDLVTKANQKTQAAVNMDYTNSRADMIASVNRNVKKNLLGFQTGEALMEAAALMDRGQVAQAVRKIDERMVVLGVAAKEWGDRDLDRDGRLLDGYKSVLAQLRDRPQMASSNVGQYLKRSLTYAGYKMTR